MRMLRIAGLLVFTFVLSSLAIAADEAKSVPKEVPDFDVHGISMTECQCTALRLSMPLEWPSRPWQLRRRRLYLHQAGPLWKS